MYPKVNQNIVIEIRNEEKYFKTIVAEVEDNEILIGFPMDLSILGLLPNGTIVNITYFAEDNLYKFQTEIIGKRNDKMPLFRLVKPKENDIKKIQRRNNFRVKANLPIKIRETEMVTIDISAGGLQFSCKEDFKIMYGEAVTGELKIPGDAEAVTFHGLVRRIIRNQLEDRKNVAIAFTTLNQRDETKVTRYCFEKQRQMRLKTK